MAQDTVVETLERPREHRENRKKNRGRKVEANQAQAIAKFIRVPPRKARLVMDAVRGRYAQDALAFLRFIPNRAAGYISKVLASAVANAANNHNLDPNRLKLVEARVDEGPRMKRVQPRAQGRAYRILKRMSHITVIVEESEPKPRKPKKAAVTRTPTVRAVKQMPSAPLAEETKPVTAVEETTPVVPVAETTPETTPVVTETLAEETTATTTEATETAETK
jgi:large subunit ribosomal protein L22